MIRIDGVVVTGHGVAGGSDRSPYPGPALVLQMPHFRRAGLDLSRLHPATVNVSLAPTRWRPTRPEITIRGVRWTDLHPPEDFSFLRATLDHGGHRYEGWVYHPHPETKADHVQPPELIELILPPVEGLQPGSRVTVELPEDRVEVDQPAG